MVMVPGPGSSEKRPKMQSRRLHCHKLAILWAIFDQTKPEKLPKLWQNYWWWFWGPKTYQKIRKLAKLVLLLIPLLNY